MRTVECADHLPLLATVEQVADFLQQSPKSIRRKLDDGQLDYVRIGRGVRSPIRIKRESVEALLTGKPVRRRGTRAGDAERAQAIANELGMI